MRGVLCSDLHWEVGRDDLLPPSCSESVHPGGMRGLLMNMQLLLVLLLLQTQGRGMQCRLSKEQDAAV